VIAATVIANGNMSGERRHNASQHHIMTMLPGSVTGGRHRLDEPDSTPVTESYTCTATTLTWAYQGKVIDVETRLSTRPYPGCCAAAQRRLTRRCIRGIIVLRLFVGAPKVEDMRTAREQREANTVQQKPVQRNEDQANLRRETWRAHAQRADLRIERDSLWSRPSCAAMSLRLGISYAFGSGQVPG
jgi:hypothetical protein